MWRNRISNDTLKLKKDYEKWNFVVHHRIANYFRLYSQVLNFQKYMLVSHRNMISVYDMTKDVTAEELSQVPQHLKKLHNMFHPLDPIKKQKRSH